METAKAKVVIGLLLRNDGFRLLLLVLFLLAPTVSFANISLQTTADKTQLAVGDHLEVVVSMEWEQTKGNDIFVVRIDPPASKSLALVDSKEMTASKLTSKGPTGTRTLRYTYLAAEAGDVTLDPVLVQYVTSPDQKDPNSKRGESIQLKIISRHKGLLHKLLRILMILAAIVFIVGAPVFLWKKGIFKKSKKNTSASHFALEKEKLVKLKEARLFQSSGDIVPLYTEAERVVTDYVEAKYGTSIHGKTTGEFESIAKSKEVPEELTKLYIKTFQVAERVRFSGLYPTKDEQEKFLRDIEFYFKSLIPKISEEDEIETIG